MAMKTGVMTITTDEQITGIWWVVARPDVKGSLCDDL